MSYLCIEYLDVIVVGLISHFLVCKLRIIVCNEGMRTVIPADDVHPEEGYSAICQDAI